MKTYKLNPCDIVRNGDNSYIGFKFLNLTIYDSLYV